MCLLLFKAGILWGEITLKGVFSGEEIRKHCPTENCFRDVNFQVVLINISQTVAYFPLCLHLIQAKYWRFTKLVEGVAVGNSRATAACGDFLYSVSQIPDTQIQIPRSYLPELQGNDRNSVEVDLAAARQPSHKVWDFSKRFYQSRGRACIWT